MGKFGTCAVRRDGAQATDHTHKLPDGREMGGALWKPAANQFRFHTHLYEYEGSTYESDPAEDVPGHTHSTELGESSGPVQPAKAPGEPYRADSAEAGTGKRLAGKVQRRGERWFAISYDNQVVGSSRREDGAYEILEAWEKEDAELRRA